MNEKLILQETATYLFHLMGCALRNASACPKPDSITWENVFRLAMRNSVQGLAWFGAKTQLDALATSPALGAPPANSALDDALAAESVSALVDLRTRWEREANRVLFHRARFDLERTQILELMDLRGLSYLPLKGINLASYYPRPEMRAMCDNDILYGYIEPAPEGGYRVCGKTEQEQDRVTDQAIGQMIDLMVARGYEVRMSYTGNHETFLKAPFFNFEMHRRLVSCDSSFGAYYDNPWERAIQDAHNPHLFHFSHEDEYLYMIVHAFKHFDHAGCGVRILADIWTFDQAKGALLDKDYLRRELETLGLVEFESQMRNLALEGLNGEKLTQEQKELLWYMAGSGTYGTVKQHLENAAKKVQSESEGAGGAASAKARYLWQRMFGTGEAFLRQNYPFFYRHKAARPLFPLYRIFRALTRNHANTLREAKAILRSGKKK